MTPHDRPLPPPHLFAGVIVVWCSAVGLVFPMVSPLVCLGDCLLFVALALSPSLLPHKQALV